MPFSDTSYNLRIELDTKGCELSAAEIEHFERALRPLRNPVEKFPVSDLYITVIFQPRSNAYRVTTALVLTGRTLATGDLDLHPYSAFERCVRKLIRKLDNYEHDLGAEEDLHKHQLGTQHDIIPDMEPDAESLERAVENQDYTLFRETLLDYEEPVRLRIGRWVQRYPEIETRIGADLTLADMVEEVFLNAFERWPSRPAQLRLGEWLEQLIDPSIRLLADHPDEELENIDFVRTMREME